MALQLNYDTDFGVVATEAYAKIISFTAEGDTITVTVGIWFNKDSYDTGHSFLSRLNYVIPYDTSAAIANLYTWLVTNAPLFASATSV